MAGGLRFKECDRPDLHKWLIKRCKLELEEHKPRCEILVPAEDLEVDDWRQLLCGLAPFGQGNPWRPIMLYHARLESVLAHDYDDARERFVTRKKQAIPKEKNPDKEAVQTKAPDAVASADDTSVPPKVEPPLVMM